MNDISLLMQKLLEAQELADELSKQGASDLEESYYLKNVSSELASSWLKLNALLQRKA